MHLSSEALRSLFPLIERRDSLLAEIASIDTEIAARVGGSTPATPPQKRAYRKSTKGKRGAVREAILAALKEAGEAGIAVRHLAAKLNFKPQNLHVWLHTSGKKSGLIRALGKGVYALEEAMGAAPEAKALKAPKPKAVKAKTPVRKKAPKARKTPAKK